MEEIYDIVDLGVKTNDEVVRAAKSLTTLQEPSNSRDST
jgi:hypothetical protein